MRRGSLQRRLATRLALVYVLAITMAVSFFIYQAYNTAGSLSDRQLGLRAADLARYVSVANGGVPRLNLPPELAAAYAAAPSAELEQAIRTAGFFRNKAKSIKACCQALVEQHGGKVPQVMEQLVALGGVGRKTANVVLGNAFNINSGIVVDTHVARLSQRLGLTRETTPEKIEQELMKLVPREQWTMFSHWLIWHGRRRCFARNPDCPHCEIEALCPRIGVSARAKPE